MINCVLIKAWCITGALYSESNVAVFAKESISSLSEFSWEALLDWVETKN